MDSPSNADLMHELLEIRRHLGDIDLRLKALEANVGVLRAAYAAQGKSLGDIEQQLRSTPPPPPFDEE